MISPELATGHNGSESIVKLENLQSQHGHHGGNDELSHSPHSDGTGEHNEDVNGNNSELNQIGCHIVSNKHNVNRPSIVKLE